MHCFNYSPSLIKFKKWSFTHDDENRRLLHLHCGATTNCNKRSKCIRTIIEHRWRLQRWSKYPSNLDSWSTANWSTPKCMLPKVLNRNVTHNIINDKQNKYRKNDEQKSTYNANFFIFFEWKLFAMFYLARQNIENVFRSYVYNQTNDFELRSVIIHRFWIYSTKSQNTYSQINLHTIRTGA